MSHMNKYTLCRLCLCSGVGIRDIFADGKKLDCVVGTMIKDLLQFEVLREEECPWLVCMTCYEKLSDFRLFKRRCLECKTVWENRFKRKRRRLETITSNDSSSPNKLSPSATIFENDSREAPPPDYTNSPSNETTAMVPPRVPTPPTALPRSNCQLDGKSEGFEEADSDVVDLCSDEESVDPGELHMPQLIDSAKICEVPSPPSDINDPSLTDQHVCRNGFLYKAKEIIAVKQFPSATNFEKGSQETPPPDYTNSPSKETAAMVPPRVPTPPTVLPRSNCQLDGKSKVVEEADSNIVDLCSDEESVHPRELHMLLSFDSTKRCEIPSPPSDINDPSLTDQHVCRNGFLDKSKEITAVKGSYMDSEDNVMDNTVLDSSGIKTERDDIETGRGVPECRGHSDAFVRQLLSRGSCNNDDEFLSMSHPLEHAQDEGKTDDSGECRGVVDSVNSELEAKASSPMEDSVDTANSEKVAKVSHPGHDSTTDSRECKISCRLCGEFLFGCSLETHLKEKHCKYEPSQACSYFDDEDSNEFLDGGHVSGVSNTSSVSLVEVIDLGVDVQDVDDYEGGTPCRGSAGHCSDIDEVTCKVCLKLIPRVGVEGHFREFHKGSARVQCKICDRLLSKNYGMKRHLAAHDQYIDRYKCSVCRKSFTRPSHLKEHYKDSMCFEVSPPRPCDVCNSEFTTTAALERHKRVEHIASPLLCTLCNYRAPNRSSLLDHLRIHNLFKLGFDVENKYFKCVHCALVFFSRDHLYMHSVIVHKMLQ